MSIYNLIVYTGNKELPINLSNIDKNFAVLQSNNISKKDINHEIQSASLLFIEDLLSFPYEWFTSQTIKPIIFLNISEDNFPEAESIYVKFMTQFMTPYDFIIANDKLTDYTKLTQVINSCHSTITPQNDISELINIISNEKLPNSVNNLNLQFDDLSLLENKLAYLNHEKIVSKIFNQILETNIKPKSRCIELTYRNIGFYHKQLLEKQWDLNLFQINNRAIPEPHHNGPDDKYSLGILAFHYHELGEELYENAIETIASSLISGGYLILIEDLLLPKTHERGLGIEQWQKLISNGSFGQLSMEHFELFQYHDLCSEITSACFLLRKLGHH